MTDYSKSLSLVFEYSSDKTSAKQVKDALDDIDKSAKKAKESVKGLGDAVDDTSRKGGKSLKALTDALDKDLAKGADKARSKLDEVDLVGRKLELLGRQIGGTWGDALAQIGGSLGAIADSADLIKGLGGLTGAGGASGIGGLGALGMGAAGLLGVGVGAAGYEGLRSAGLAQKGSASLGQFASVAAYGAGKIFSEETAQKWFKSVAESVGELPAPAEKATKAIRQLAQETAQAGPKLDAFHTVGQVSSGLGVNLPDANTIQLSTFQRNTDAIKKEQEFEDQRLTLIRDARDDELEAENDYNRERKQQIKTFNLETKQLEKQHEIDMRRMREDANKRLSGLAIERDAVSYLQEWDASQTAIKRANEDFKNNQRNRKDNFDLQLAQDKEDFAAMQTERRKQAQKQLDDLKAQTEQETAIKKKGYQSSYAAAHDFVSGVKDLFNSLPRYNQNNSRSSSYYYIDGNGKQRDSSQDELSRKVDKHIGQTLGLR